MKRDLTEKQLAKLKRLWSGAEYHIAGKPEVRALERRGLVSTNEFRCTAITDAGRALLAEARDER